MNSKFPISFYAISMLVAVFVANQPVSARQNERQQPISIELKTPRNYGYSLGDRITVTALIRTSLFYSLDTAALPQPGPVNEWLQRVSVRSVEAPEDFDYALAVTYQVFKYAPAPTKLTLPAWPLQFTHGGQTLTEELPAWTFSYNPMTTDADSLIEPEPEKPPALIDTGGPGRRLIFWLTAIAALSFYILWFYGKAPLLERYSGAFGKACRTLKQLKKQPASQENLLQALQCFHHALNESAGETVFAAQLPEYFQRFPRYRPLQEQTEDLFELSRQVFFSQVPDRAMPKTLDIGRIEALCLRYRKFERGGRWS